MDADHTSDPILAHFDRPRVVSCPTFEWIEEPEPTVGYFPAPDPPQLGFDSGKKSTILAPPTPLPWDVVDDGRPAYKYGVGSVLQFAAAIAVLGFAAIVLTEFICIAKAEHKLSRAAQAGLVEATLPRATLQTITETVERHLASYPQLHDQLQICLMQNGIPVERWFHPTEGDKLSIALSAPSDSAIPAWLHKLSPWHDRTTLKSQVAAQVPGRKLRPMKS